MCARGENQGPSLPEILLNSAQNTKTPRDRENMKEQGPNEKYTCLYSGVMNGISSYCECCKHFFPSFVEGSQSKRDRRSLETPTVIAFVHYSLI